ILTKKFMDDKENVENIAVFGEDTIKSVAILLPDLNNQDKEDENYENLKTMITSARLYKKYNAVNLEMKRTINKMIEENKPKEEIETTYDLYRTQRDSIATDYFMILDSSLEIKNKILQDIITKESANKELDKVCDNNTGDTPEIFVDHYTDLYISSLNKKKDVSPEDELVLKHLKKDEIKEQIKNNPLISVEDGDEENLIIIDSAIKHDLFTKLNEEIVYELDRCEDEHGPESDEYKKLLDRSDRLETLVRKYTYINKKHKEKYTKEDNGVSENLTKTIALTGDAAEVFEEAFNDSATNEETRKMKFAYKTISEKAGVLTQFLNGKTFHYHKARRMEDLLNENHYNEREEVIKKAYDLEKRVRDSIEAAEQEAHDKKEKQKIRAKKWTEEYDHKIKTRLDQKEFDKRKGKDFKIALNLVEKKKDVVIKVDLGNKLEKIKKNLEDLRKERLRQQAINLQQEFIRLEQEETERINNMSPKEKADYYQKKSSNKKWKKQIEKAKLLFSNENEYSLRIYKEHVQQDIKHPYPGEYGRKVKYYVDEKYLKDYAAENEDTTLVSEEDDAKYAKYLKKRASAASDQKDLINQLVYCDFDISKIKDVDDLLDLRDEDIRYLRYNCQIASLGEEAFAEYFNDLIEKGAKEEWLRAHASLSLFRSFNDRLESVRDYLTDEIRINIGFEELPEKIDEYKDHWRFQQYTDAKRNFFREREADEYDFGKGLKELQDEIAEEYKTFWDRAILKRDKNRFDLEKDIEEKWQEIHAAYEKRKFEYREMIEEQERKQEEAEIKRQEEEYEEEQRLREEQFEENAWDSERREIIREDVYKEYENKRLEETKVSDSLYDYLSENHADVVENLGEELCRTYANAFAAMADFEGTDIGEYQEDLAETLDSMLMEIGIHECDNKIENVKKSSDLSEEEIRAQIMDLTETKQYFVDEFNALEAKVTEVKKRMKRFLIHSQRSYLDYINDKKTFNKGAHPEYERQLIEEVKHNNTLIDDKMLYDYLGADLISETIGNIRGLSENIAYDHKEDVHLVELHILKLFYTNILADLDLSDEQLEMLYDEESKDDPELMELRDKYEEAKDKLKEVEKEIEARDKFNKNNREKSMEKLVKYNAFNNDTIMDFLKRTDYADAVEYTGGGYPINAEKLENIQNEINGCVKLVKGEDEII
nr:hypothetical protein [Lachnospiraceae bacterium]